MRPGEVIILAEWVRENFDFEVTITKILGGYVFLSNGERHSLSEIVNCEV